MISASLTPQVGTLLRNYVRRKEFKIDSNLKKKLRESLEYLKVKMAASAPSKSGELKEIILSLPISSGSKNTSFSFSKSGTLILNLRLNRRKDRQILWVDRGTGIYGPFRRKIRPINGEFLRFKINNRWVRTRSVKGQKGQRFIKKAINASKLIISGKIKSALKD